MLCAPLPAQDSRARPNHFVEIRSYNLKPGMRDRFHQTFLTEALPMLNRWKVDVVAYGPSLHDSDSYYLMRAYPSLEARQKSEDAFYGSDEWKQVRPRCADFGRADRENSFPWGRLHIVQLAPRDFRQVPSDQ
jgi:hypothetical protein